MKVELIQGALSRQPFEPFVLTTTSGYRWQIGNPLYAEVRVASETVCFWRDSERTEMSSIVDIGHVKTLEYTTINGDAA